MPSVQLPKKEALIVDDDVRARELLSEFCRGQGFEVATAHDGRAAIAAITRDPEQFAVIITDLHLPGADGFEVLRAARDANPSVYVVMITGYASIDSAVRAVREGAYDYLAKPFALGQLEVVLTRIRDRMALEQENRELSKLVGGRDGHAMPPISAGGSRRSRSGSRISKPCCARGPKFKGQSSKSVSKFEVHLRTSQLTLHFDL